MDFNKLLFSKLFIFFSYLFVMTNIIRKYILNEVALLNEEYPSGWNIQDFANLSSFSLRKKYCDRFLTKISSGTGRIVYKIDNEKVLKLAKNSKGLAQCEAEINLSKENYFNHLYAKVLEYDEDGKWVEMELATKLTASKFQAIMGYPYEEYCSMLFDCYSENVLHERNYRRTKVKNYDIIVEDDLYKDICDLMVNYKMPAGDLTKLTSYGIVLDDGDQKVVLVDYGLTGLVFNNHYRHG